MNREAETPMVRRTLFDGDLLRVDHIVARPSSPACGEIERQSLNVLVLPITGVFAKHDGPRRHLIATSNHAVLLAADAPYRISFPGSIGDQCLALRMSGAGLARVMPEMIAGDGFDASVLSSHALLPPALMLARNLLCRRLAGGAGDPLEVEELGIGLLVSTLRAARKEHAGRRHGTPRGSGRRSRQIERVKEAVSIHPERKWTLGDLADLACVSPWHLAHVFREEVGTSVYRYVLRSRLAKALDTVLDSDTDLTAIALEAGFASHSHFTARFRALFGLTPAALRGGADAGTAAELRKAICART
jgi:AraC-like DNA-binding protein